jgi:uncharacterized protein
MFSLQRILGDDVKFCVLLEDSALEACQSVVTLKRVLAASNGPTSLEVFAATRRKDKKITGDISELLIRTSVTAMEREDIEALADALYRIPKTVEKFAERYIISSPRLQATDFARQFDLMERAINMVLEMVRTLRQGIDLPRTRQLNANIQKIESDADDVILELIGQLYAPAYDPLKRIIMKDLFELNEKVVDRCRDAGNVIARLVLKNS